MAPRFATAVTAERDGTPLASRLATLLRRSSTRQERLFTHIDRRNSQLKTIEPRRELLLVAYGPDAYLSLAWYAAVGRCRARTTSSFTSAAGHRCSPTSDERPELIEWLLAETVAEYESRRPAPWEYDVPASFHTGLGGVVGFEIKINSIEGAFKLCQDKQETDRRGLIDALAVAGDSSVREIAELMQCELDDRHAHANAAGIPSLAHDSPFEREDAH
jgi:transcriptional regulator